jgi:hypothetical protein
MYEFLDEVDLKILRIIARGIITKESVGYEKIYRIISASRKIARKTLTKRLVNLWKRELILRLEPKGKHPFYVLNIGDETLEELSKLKDMADLEKRLKEISELRNIFERKNIGLQTSFDIFNEKE